MSQLAHTSLILDLDRIATEEAAPLAAVFGEWDRGTHIAWGQTSCATGGRISL
jgi:hypothetical protein